MVAFLFYAPGFTGLRGFRNTPTYREICRFRSRKKEGARASAQTALTEICSVAEERTEVGDIISGFFLFLVGAVFVLFPDYVRVFDTSLDNVDTADLMQKSPPPARWMQRLSQGVGLAAILLGIVAIAQGILQELSQGS